jgi:hypothetical protein
MMLGSHDQVQNLVHPSMFPFVANVSPAQEPAASELKAITERLSARARTEGAALFASMRNVPLSTFLDEKGCAQWQELQGPVDLEREADLEHIALPSGADGDSLHVGLQLRCLWPRLLLDSSHPCLFGAVCRWCAEAPQRLHQSQV